MNMGLDTVYRMSTIFFFYLDWSLKLVKLPSEMVGQKWIEMESTKYRLSIAMLPCPINSLWPYGTSDTPFPLKRCQSWCGFRKPWFSTSLQAKPSHNRMQEFNNKWHYSNNNCWEFYLWLSKKIWPSNVKCQHQPAAVFQHWYNIIDSNYTQAFTCVFWVYGEFGNSVNASNV